MKVNARSKKHVSETASSSAININKKIYESGPFMKTFSIIIFFQSGEVHRISICLCLRGGIYVGETRDLMCSNARAFIFK